MNAAASSERTTSTRAWATVAFLNAAYAMSFIDRLVIGLLVPSMRISLHLSDLQMGLLMGPAFAICYALAGLPLGALVDRYSRPIIIAAAVLVWSAATMASGMAGGFATLFCLRIVVGIGEAAIAPASISLIGDLFAPARRAMAVSVFAFGVSLGASAAFILGGWLLKVYAGHADAWRLVFITVGAPGLLMAALALTLPRGVRREAGPADKVRALPWALANVRYLVGHFAGFGLVSTITVAFISWVPSLLVREHAMTPTDVGSLLGILLLAAGIAGGLAGGAATGWLTRRGRLDAALLVVMAGILVMGITATLAPLVSSSSLCVGLYAVAFCGLGFSSGPSLAALQNAVPPPLRGRIAALYYMTVNILGQSLGPVLVPLVMKISGGLGSALSLTSLTVAAIGLVVVGLALRPFRVLVRREA